MSRISDFERCVWHAIETLPARGVLDMEDIVLAKFYQPRLDTGEPDPERDVDCVWAAIGHDMPDGYGLLTTSFDGMCGGIALFKLRDDATHWMRLPKTPEKVP